MRVWLTKLGEPLSIDGKVRLHRTGILAEILAEEGHEVTYWTSTFSHALKKQRYLSTHILHIRENYRTVLLHAPGYQKNVGIARIMHHRRVAKQFAKRLANELAPDIIFCAFPVVDMISACLQYAKPRNIPVVVDVRDHWPDIFLNLVPKWFQPFARLGLQPAFRANTRIFSAATAITGVSEKQLQWGLAYAGRPKHYLDQVFHHGYPALKVTEGEKVKAKEVLRTHDINPDQFICCFFGAISRQFDLETIISAARQLQNQGIQSIKFVLCGSGSHLEYYRKLAADLQNVVFPGWINQSEIAVLMEWSKIGLAPYKAEDSMAVPNKPIEYFSGGLPVLSSLHGELENILCENDCGFTYEPNNVQGFLDKLLYLYNTPTCRTDMGKNATRLFVSQFSAQRVYTSLIHHLTKIANKES